MIRPSFGAPSLVVCFVLTGCAPESLEGVTWACASDDECDAGASCREGLCITTDACELGDGQARFTVGAEAGERTLTFEANGHIVRFSLPAEVVALDGSPIAGCCENPCCAFTE